MRNLLVTATLLLVAGCGGGGASGAAPKAQPSPVAKVGLQTTCDRIFSQGPGDTGLWGQATNLVQARAEGGAWNESEGGSVRDQLGEIAASSEGPIRPHIEAMAEAVDSEADLDVSTYKASGTEVANICAPYVAG